MQRAKKVNTVGAGDGARREPWLPIQKSIIKIPAEGMRSTIQYNGNYAYTYTYICLYEEIKPQSIQKIWIKLKAHSIL